MPLSHAKWFVLGPADPDWGLLMDPRVLGLVLGVIAVVAVLATISRQQACGGLSACRPSAPFAGPRLLAGTLGVTLAIAAARGWLLLPGVSLNGVPGHDALLVAEAAVGLWLISGLGIPLAAGAVGALCAALAAIGGPLTLLEGAYLPAIALYLALASGASPTAVRRAGPAWRALAIGLGLALVVGALSEKLLAPTVALSVLQAHPSLNILSDVGVDATTFVLLVGAGELLLGLVIATGLGGRIVPAVALTPFVLTVPVLGIVEFVGHLPIYATLIVLATHPQASTAAVGGPPPRLNGLRLLAHRV